MVSELDARCERGQETRRMFGGGSLHFAQKAMDVANDIFING